MKKFLVLTLKPDSSVFLTVEHATDLRVVAQDHLGFYTKGNDLITDLSHPAVTDAEAYELPWKVRLTR